MIIQVSFSEAMINRSPKLASARTIEVDLPDGARVADLLQRLELAKPGDAVVVRSSQVQRADSLLNDGDCVTILPVVEGG